MSHLCDLIQFWTSGDLVICIPVKARFELLACSWDSREVSKWLVPSFLHCLLGCNACLCLGNTGYSLALVYTSLNFSYVYHGCLILFLLDYSTHHLTEHKQNRGWAWYISSHWMSRLLFVLLCLLERWQNFSPSNVHWWKVFLKMFAPWMESLPWKLVLTNCFVRLLQQWY